MIGIYKITNPKNKIYIGQSCDIEKRFKLHINSINNLNDTKTKLQKSFIKYGIENHIFEIIEECLIDNLNKRELYYQKEYNCVLNGLNGVFVSEKCNYNRNNYQNLTKKLIHLDEKTIELLTIKAIKERTTFKVMAQKVLTKLAKDYERGIL